MSDEPDTTVDRRTVLKRGAAGALGLAGVATQGLGAAAQDPDPTEREAAETAQAEPDRPRYTRRAALRYPERLEGGPRRKILLLTDRTDDDPDVSEVDGCGFSNWPPDKLTIWEGIIVDWQNATDDVRLSVLRGTPTVRANRLVEINNIYLDEQETPVELGTTFIVNGVVDCPGEFRGLAITQVPGVQIKTGPGVSTSG